jgi:hypothetical protein
MPKELIYQRVDSRLFAGYGYDEYPFVRKWCIAHFGPSVIKGVKERKWHGKLEAQHTPIGRRYRAAFYFRDRAHATFFALHWA